MPHIRQVYMLCVYITSCKQCSCFDSWHLFLLCAGNFRVQCRWLLWQKLWYYIWDSLVYCHAQWYLCKNVDFDKPVYCRYIWTFMTPRRITGFAYWSENGHNFASFCTLGMFIYVPLQLTLEFLEIYQFP